MALGHIVDESEHLFYISFVSRGQIMRGQRRERQLVRTLGASHRVTVYDAVKGSDGKWYGIIRTGAGNLRVRLRAGRAWETLDRSAKR